MFLLTILVTFAAIAWLSGVLPECADATSRCPSQQRHPGGQGPAQPRPQGQCFRALQETRRPPGQATPAAAVLFGGRPRKQVLIINLIIKFNKLIINLIYFIKFKLILLIFPFTFLGRNPSSQLFLCTLHFISPLKQLKALLITTTQTGNERLALPLTRLG